MKPTAKKERGNDWVQFQLKAEAPERVARGGQRFAGVFERAAQPFRCPRAEWRVCWSKMGYFELITEHQDGKDGEIKPFVKREEN